MGTALAHARTCVVNRTVCRVFGFSQGLHQFCVCGLADEDEPSDNPTSTLSPPTLKMKARTGDH
jgi:hypothetical protein